MGHKICLPSHLFIYLLTCFITFGVNFLNNFTRRYMSWFLKYWRVRKIKIRDSISTSDSNFHIDESSNIFKITLSSTNADFICDNHVQVTQLFASSTLLAQSRTKDFMPL